jgi:S-DNA-T family DNA segregation ATPase FtsK/SpoIIIE
MELIDLRPPPVVERAEVGGALMSALPVLGSLGSIGLVATMGGGPRQYVGLGLFVAAAVLVAAAQLDRQRRQRTRAVDAVRRDYLAHLADVRVRLRATAESRRTDAVARHPPPRALAALAECGAWRPGDGLTVRYGTADLAGGPAPTMPDLATRADPFCAAAVRRLVTAHSAHPGFPATVDLVGTRALTAPLGTARAVVCSAAGCPEVVIAVLAPPAAQERWEWVKWLSQASGTVADDVGPRRLVAGSMTDLSPLLPERRHLLLVLDGVPPPALDGPATLLHVADRLTADGRTLPGVPDECTAEVAEAFARRSRRAVAPAFPAAPEWSARSARDRLRIPLGVSDTGAEVLLDLKESALGGSGPHGMVVGATGSGKSELLRSLVPTSPSPTLRPSSTWC